MPNRDWRFGLEGAPLHFPSPHSPYIIFSLEMEPSAILVKVAEPYEVGLSSITPMLPLLDYTATRHQYFKTA